LRGLEKARDLMAQEVNIIEIVKSRRILSQALKRLLPPEKHKQLKVEYEYIDVNPSSDSSSSSSAVENGFDKVDGVEADHSSKDEEMSVRDYKIVSELATISKIIGP